MENVLMVLFEVESEAYQALAELRHDAVNSSYTISQMGLVKNKEGRILPCEGFDSGVDTRDDMVKGGLIGGLLGILGGPIGMLFTGSMGALIGSVKDSSDAEKNVSMLERVSGKMGEGNVALIALVQEEDESILNRCLSKFKTETIRWDAAVIAEEVEEAQKLEKEMKRQAKERMRDQKKEEYRQNLEQKRAKIHADFEMLKERMKG